MLTLDDIGATIERQLDVVELRFGANRIGSAVLGAMLATGLVLGGLAAFIAVFAILVRFFS